MKTTCDRFGDRERGAGTVMMAGLVAVVLLIILAVAALGAATVGRSKAQSAADLAALGAARALAEARVGLPAEDPCGTAGAIVSANGAALRRCVVDEAAGIVAVIVARDVAGIGHATARARAGPSPASSSTPSGEPRTDPAAD